MNQSGQSIVESLFVLILAGTLMLLLSVASYGFFAHAWIGYQTDQALFCLAEGGRSMECRMKTETALKTYLPWRKNLAVQLSDDDSDIWTARVEMQWNEVKIRTNRKLKWDSSLWR